MKYIITILLSILFCQSYSQSVVTKTSDSPDGSVINVTLTASPVNPFYSGPIVSGVKKTMLNADGIEIKEKTTITEITLIAVPQNENTVKNDSEKKIISTDLTKDKETTDIIYIESTAVNIDPKK